MSGLRDFYEDTLVSFQYGESHPNYTEAIFKQAILPRVHMRINNFTGTKQTLQVLSDVIVIDVPNDGEKFSVDLSQYNTNITRIGAGLTNQNGDNYELYSTNVLGQTGGVSSFST